MLPDGRIVAVGGSGQSSAVENLRLSGASVGYSGDTAAPWLRPVGASYSYANAAVALPDGRGILSAGVATERSGHPGMALVRTSPEGAPDPRWDGDGIALVRARDGSVATDVVLEPERPRGRRRPLEPRREARVHARPLRRLRSARPQLRRPGRGAHRASPARRSRARPRWRARPTASSSPRASPARRRQRPAVRRRDRAARARPLPGRRRRAPGARPAAAPRRPPAAPRAPRRSSRCPRA